MTIQDAKTIPLDVFLERLGHLPIKTISGEFWYRSPWRDEKTPSFKLSRNRMAWFDHGTGQGGNILDLARHCGQIDSLPGALNYIARVVGTDYTLPVIGLASTPVPTAPAYQLGSADPLYLRGKSAAYLRSRGIDPRAVAPYARDLTFSPASAPSRRLYGVGILNESGGYETRVRLGEHYRKTCIGPKDISFFPATLEGRSYRALHLFEGAPDFYTYLTIYQPLLGEESYLILNGTGETARALAFLSAMPFRMVAIWSQYGEGGQRTEEQLLNFLSGQGVAAGTMKHLYAGFEDLNAWHMAKGPPVALRGSRRS